MFWIVALATIIIAVTVVRHAMQDHRDAEVQRRDALADIERDWTPAAGGAARGDVEMAREVERDVAGTSGVSIPPAARGTAKPQSDDHARAH